MFGKTEAGVTDSERAVTKMINFGIAYGVTVSFQEAGLTAST
jgi:DNA polymerase I-like protein with 3'-5' exonuclease and polymerase domains